MTTSGPTPEDLETVAAFIDQRLSAEERSAFMERLDADEALYEVFVETVRCREEASGEEAEILRHPASWRSWALPAAAALAAGLALAIGILLIGRGGSYGEVLLADGRLQDHLVGDWYLQGWSNLRGSGVETDSERAAFRLGVRVVDLEVALRARRLEDAALLAAHCERHLRGIEFSELWQVDYGQLRSDLEGGRPPQELLAEAGRIDRDLSEFFGDDLGPAFELGQWAETGKLAARSDNRDLLSSRAFRRTPERLGIEAAETRFGAALGAVRAALAEEGAGPDTDRLEELFAALISEG